MWDDTRSRPDPSACHNSMKDLGRVALRDTVACRRVKSRSHRSQPLKRNDVVAIVPEMLVIGNHRHSGIVHHLAKPRLAAD